MQTYLPKAEHRMCARHIYANWRKKHRHHEFQKMFWAIAKSCNREDFMYNKAKLAQKTPEGAKDIMKTDPKHWARSFFELGVKCESVDNNLCESFNHAIIDARFYPIITMLEKIRGKVFVRVQEQREKGAKMHGTICPAIFKKLKISIKMTQFLEVMWNGKEGFEVKHLKGRQRRYTVNLQNRTCSCGYFQLAGLPCCHAICAIYKCGKTIDEFIDNCYSIEAFNRIYEHCLEPVEGEDKWPVSPKPRPQAPGYVRMPGRPKKNDRRREEGEAPKGKKMSRAGIVITCSFCGVTGHNKSGCHKNPEKGKKKNAHLVKSGKKMKQSEVNAHLVNFDKSTVLLHVHVNCFLLNLTIYVFHFFQQAQTDGAKAAAASASATASSAKQLEQKKLSLQDLLPDQPLPLQLFLPELVLEEILLQ
jgi:hypothetical protein